MHPLEKALRLDKALMNKLVPFASLSSGTWKFDDYDFGLYFFEMHR